MGEKLARGPQNGRSQLVVFLFVSFTILQVIKSVNPSVHAEFGEGKQSQVHEFQGGKTAAACSNLQRYIFAM